MSLSQTAAANGKSASLAIGNSNVLVLGEFSPKWQDFRLTLTSNTPVTTSNVTGASTVYCTPYIGNTISLFDGNVWKALQSSEFSITLSALTSSKPYDVFCYDNTNVPTLEILAWTDNTTRATALTYKDGVLVKSGDNTRRYLGSFYSTSTTTTEDSETSRYLWNYYNRVSKPMVRKESTASWAYTTETWRQANGSTSNQLNYICGMPEDLISANILANASNTSTGRASVAIGVDSVSSTSNGIFGSGQASASGYGTELVAHYIGSMQLGRHYLAWLEYSQAVGTTTWYTSSVGAYQGGIFGSSRF